MYGTGKIGFWSLMEEGIGIIAGSLPALRPLLSLKVGFSSSMNTPTPGGYASGRSEPRSKVNRNILSRQDALALNTFQTLNGGEEYVARSLADYEAQVREKLERSLRRKARSLGYELVPRPAVAPSPS